MKSPTKWMKYPMKVSELINGHWRIIWNNIGDDEFSKMFMLISAMRQKSPHIGGGGGNKGMFLQHTGKGNIDIGDTVKEMITVLEKEGIIKDDIGIDGDYEFKI